MYMNFNQVLRNYVFSVQMKRKKDKILQCMVNAGTEEAAREYIANLGFNDKNCNIKLLNASA